MYDGIVPQCKLRSSKCHYKCCTFTDNYIVLYPGEYEQSNLNKGHLKIIDDDYYGEKKAVCTRHCTGDDFKPLDCKIYPFFPIIDSDGKLKLLKGKKCPLTNDELAEHKGWVLKKWGELILNKKIRDWLKRVKLVGYEIVNP